MQFMVYPRAGRPASVWCVLCIVISGINLWVVTDNIRKGAALNAVQIAELLVQNAFYRH